MADQVFKKETEYNVNENNFIGESEITVTITLNEYRELVSHMATRDNDVKTSEREARDARIRANELDEENAGLKAELYELQKKLEAQNAEVNPDSVVNPEETVEVQTWE